MNEKKISMQELYESVNKANSFQFEDVVIKNFRLVKILLPIDVYNKLISQYETIYIDKSVENERTFMGVPCEKSNCNRLQYVIEGEIKKA